ncbi:lipopolysaccharide biosynthesis protein [Pseudonocardia sp. H11422]|uniref:lipopolysaccharide biosynthesis protein n=1 Tax=Pseudonocardia sp. H11422 TaxID=2835866 RepID=UPI001BDBFF7C|nr:oligosaccharide flippase family protein [Pseudonocardia sp. H11422]
MPGRHRDGDEGLGQEAAKAAAPGALGKTMRRGAKISAFALIFVQVVSLVGTLLQARFLDPSEVGLYAAGTVLTGFMIMFAEGGLRLALVQRDTDIENAADTVFWVTFAGGVLMSLAALAAAPIVGRVFGNDDAADIAAITSGMLLMYALINVPEGLLQRNFNFKKRLIVDPARALAFAVVSVAMAASGFGVWSLVVGNYVSLGVWLVGVWVFARWRPGRGRFSFPLWREMARFGYPLLIERVIDQARESGQAALLGRSLGEASLGGYRYGRRLAMLPATAVVDVGSYVIFPAFSRLNGDPERLRNAFLRALHWIWFGAAPVAAVIVAIGEPLIVVLLGEKWRGAGTICVAMAGFGIGVALYAVASEAIKASGQTRLLNWTSAANLVLGLGLFVVLLPFGLVGVGLAISATEIVLGVLTLALARKVVGFGIAEAVRRLYPPVAGGLVALAVIGPLEHWVVMSDGRGFFLGAVLLIAEVLGFALIYLAVLRVLDPPMVATLVGAARSKLRKRGAGEADVEPDSDEELPGWADSETMIIPAIAAGLSVSDAGEPTVRFFREPVRRPTPYPRPRPGTAPPPGSRPDRFGMQNGRPGTNRTPPQGGSGGPGVPGASGPGGLVPGNGRPVRRGASGPIGARPASGAPPAPGAARPPGSRPAPGRPSPPGPNGTPPADNGPAAPDPNGAPTGNGPDERSPRYGGPGSGAPTPRPDAASPRNGGPETPRGPRPSPRPRPRPEPPVAPEPVGPERAASPPREAGERPVEPVEQVVDGRMPPRTE